MIEEFLLAFIPLFVAIDVFGALPLFMAFTEDFEQQHRKKLVAEATLTAFVISLVFLVTGKLLFSFLGITESDFRVGGGIVLLVLAVNDLLVIRERKRDLEGSVGVVPIGIPLIMGPAALTTIIILVELYRRLRKYWVRWCLEKKRSARKLRKPPVLKPKSERDCPVCQGGKGKTITAQTAKPEAWCLRKGCGGRKKQISTAGYFCPNPDCEYFGISDERVHALVGYGTNAWPTRSHPGSEMPGLRQEVHHAPEHPVISSQKPFRFGRESAVAAGFRGGCISPGRSL